MTETSCQRVGFRRDLILPVALILAAVAGLFGMYPYAQGYGAAVEPVFQYASRLWQLEDWQHCVLVPFAVAVFLWLDRRRLAALPLRGAWAGLPIVIVAMFLYWFGHLADIIYFGYASMQLLLAGLIILLMGWQWMRALAFPWLFLNFMWPLLFLDNFLAFPLRIIMSKASAAVLNFIGVPTVLSGTAVLSASDALTGKPVGRLFSVDVADPCSGIRSLFALMMVSALYGHFALKAWWKKWILFFASVPLAVLGNLFRIMMLTFGTIAMGSEVAIGSIDDPSFYHMLSGYLVFAVALGGMLGVSSLLNMNPRGLRHRIRGLLSMLSSPAPARSAPALSPTGSKPLPPRHDAY